MQSGSTIVTITDHTVSRSIAIILEPQDKAAMGERWEDQDILLEALQRRMPTTIRHTRLCDIDLTLFRLLIGMHLSARACQSVEEQGDPETALNRSIFILVLGLVYLLEQRAEGNIPFMTINRINMDKVTFEYHAVLHDLITVSPKSPPGLRVIVNNED